jgi:hypothetical protein
MMFVAAISTMLAVAKGHEHIKVQYDRFKEQTTISTDDVMVSSGPGREVFFGVLPPFVQFSYVCPEDVSTCKPESVAVLFKAFRPNDRGEWVYLNSRALVFLADGKRILPVTEEKWQGETSDRLRARSALGPVYKQSGTGSSSQPAPHRHMVSRGPRHRIRSFRTRGRSLGP